MKRSKISVIILCIAMLCGILCLSALGADDGSLALKASISGKNMDISLQNKSQSYLGNVKVSVKAPDGTVLVLTADGQFVKSGNESGDTVRALSPAGTKKFSAGLGQYAPVVETTPKVTTQTTVTTKKPTPPPATSATTTQTTPPPVVTTEPPVIDIPVQTEEPTPVIPSESTVPDTTVETEETVITTEDTTEDTTVETTENTTELTTEVTTEVVTEGTADITTETVTEDDAVVSPDDDKGAPVGLIIGIIAGVVVIGAGVALLIIFKKKRSVSSVIVIAVLLSGLGAVGGLEADAATAVSTVTDTVTTEGGTFTVTVTYKSVPAPVTNPLKNTRRPPAGDECNVPQVDERRIVEGAGPLTTSKIYIGKNDMMFNGDELNMYRGETAKISDARLNKLATMMNDRDAWAKENGIKLYFVICPNKCSVYSDYIPSSVKRADVTLTDRAVDYLAANSTVEVIDLTDALIAGRSTYGDDLYYNYDTHWNNNGGFVAYTEIMRRINEDVPGAITLQKSDFEVTEAETYMKDMAYYLGFYSKFQDYGPVYTLKSGMTATIGDKMDDGYWGQFRFCSKWKDGYTDALKYVEYDSEYNDGAPNLYMYRDSYSLGLIHFMKDSFDKSAFDWSFEFNKAEILRSGADVVIIEVVERSIPEIISSRTFVD